MGGKSSKTTVGYKFYAGAVVVFAKYIHRIWQIKIGDKVAFETEDTPLVDGATAAIDMPVLFGTKVEGGVVGDFVFQGGKPDQMPDEYLTPLLGEDLPASRGVSQLVLRQPYLGNVPYIKDLEILAERIQELDGGAAQWFPERASVWPPGLLPPGSELVCTIDEDAELVYRSGGMHPTPQLSNLGVYTYAGIDPEDSMPGFLSGGSAVLATDTFVFRTNTDSGRSSYRVVIGGPDNWHSLNLNIITPDNVIQSFWPGYILAEPSSPEAVAAEWAVTLAAEAHPFSITGSTHYKLWYPAPEGYSGSIFDVAGNHDFSVYKVDNESKCIEIYPEGPDINAPHLLRECLTNNEWGYGNDVLDIDDESFKEAAKTLFDEGVGLSYFWDDERELDEIIKRVEHHIEGVLRMNRVTSKWEIKLIRADYDVDELIELRASHEVSKIDNYKKPQFMELANVVNVNYYNRELNSNAAVSQSEPGLFLQQGRRVPKSFDYEMCCTPELANLLLQREFNINTQPLVECDVYATSAAKSLRRGDVFKLTAPRYNFNQTVMRIKEINYGDGKSKVIKISCIEDRFTKPLAPQVAIPEVSIPSNPLPAVLDNRLLIEEPYAMIIARTSQEQVDVVLDADISAGFFGASAARNAGALTANIFVDSGSGYNNASNLDFCPFGTLTADISYLTNTFTLENLSDIDEVTEAMIFQIDNEIMQGVVSSSGVLTSVKRGVFDTVPAVHTIGAKAFFIGDWLDGSDVQYVEGEEIDVKILPLTSRGWLEIGAAPADTLEFVGRAGRPYAPGLFKIGGSSYPTGGVSGSFTVTWAHRDRVAQSDQIVDTLQASLSLPTNQRYGLRFTKVSDSSLLVERTDIGAATATCVLNYTGDVLVELWTINNEGISFQRHSFVIAYTSGGSNSITATTYTPVDDATIIDGGGDA